MADNRRGLAAEIEMAVAKVRMAIVPSDEVVRVTAPGPIFAGDAQGSAEVGAGGENDHVITVPELVDRHIGFDPNPADERNPGVVAILSKVDVTCLSFGWSGATPNRTSP